MRQNSSSSNHSLTLLVLAVVLPLLGGCSTLSYYGQAAAGHLEITFKRRDIDRLLADESTPEALARRLKRVQDIRRFAVEELALPDSGSYSKYADLDRDVTVWLVTAAPPLSVEPRRWCYPFVGCLAYRGYFERRCAEAAVERLRAQGLDTAVSPAVAYSTLGLMDDPVLNTMLAYDDADLAGLIFHELAHERVFVPGDTRFNESFAATVEKLGRERYVAARELPFDREADRRRLARREALTELLLDLRSQLQTVYQAPLDEATKLELKAELGAEAQARFAALRRSWDGDAGFDGWFDDGPPNNAELALVATYRSEIGAFEALFLNRDEDFERFYAAVEALGSLDPAARRARLAALARQPVAGP